jgi:hypothetical protein
MGKKAVLADFNALSTTMTEENHGSNKAGAVSVRIRTVYRQRKKLFGYVTLCLLSTLTCLLC